MTLKRNEIISQNWGLSMATSHTYEKTYTQGCVSPNAGYWSTTLGEGCCLGAKIELAHLVTQDRQWEMGVEG